MRRITELSKTSTLRVAVCARLAAAVGAVHSGHRVQPDADKAQPRRRAATAAASSAQGTSQSWEDFKATGGTVGRRGPVSSCVAAWQPLPVAGLPARSPPPDRPETVVLKRWRNGVFDANVLLDPS